jgi:hypothetical protein
MGPLTRNSYLIGAGVGIGVGSIGAFKSWPLDAPRERAKQWALAAGISIAMPALMTAQGPLHTRLAVAAGLGSVLAIASATEGVRLVAR